uniref:SWI5-dependent HO expression protein 3 n=1 Tax=Meloidogyne hapla TaxID=6305 RepID=A0A1I8C0G5_MELHA
MSYQGSSSISNGRRYDDVRKIPIPSKYHKSSKKDGKEESRHSNNLNYLHGGSSSSAQKSSYESRNESLSQQLGAAQSQVIRLETELSNTNTAKSYAESRLLTLQREYNAVVKRNAEIVEVMKTLEIGVETLQQEKVALVSERDELKAKLDASENNSRMLSEQVTFLNERNTTLSKKCVDLLDGSKDIREKVALYENELKRIKPRYEEMEANFDAINENNRNYSTRINMFEMRERIWIKEKTEMEERQKQNVENWQKIIADIRTKHEAEMSRFRQQHQQQQPPMVMGISKAEKDKMDRHSVSFLLFLNIKLGDLVI